MSEIGSGTLGAARTPARASEPTSRRASGRASGRTASARTNRGPAVAAENRRAILAAARRLFAERGFEVPLSAIAREAGIGQGVLYRHFRSRLDLAIEVFDDNFLELEAAAADPAPDAFDRLWRLLLAQTVREAAFVEMAVEAQRLEVTYDGDARLAALVSLALGRAQAAGTADPALTLEDVLVSWRMAFGIVATAPNPAEAERLLAQRLPRPIPLGQPLAPVTPGG
ncbi:TetR/AcrR family transcriptional regulator [Miniimonas arenae]|uniref:TetR/AcrR family transcriptional regulator n=1 Tax=Miniimonas arenae TaxID=676201 RepID=UPI001FEC3ADB|nr:TetR/AcrR family transcriptional regulator [Miniimonas arenae]